jgi:hypothetical protein
MHCTEGMCIMKRACFPLHVLAPVLLVVRPRVQLVQMVLPAAAAAEPFGQAVHVALLVREGTKPALQQTHSLMLPTACFLQDWQPALQPILVRVVLSGRGVHAAGTCAVVTMTSYVLSISRAAPSRMNEAGRANALLLLQSSRRPKQPSRAAAACIPGQKK